MVGETLGALGTALEDWRLDADYEELRLAADLYRAREGSSPRLTVMRWGRPAEFHARQLWLENLLAAAGVSAQLEDAVESPDQFRAPSSGGPVLLCASDERLAEGGIQAVKTLRERGFSEIWVAGRPFAPPEEIEGAGVAGFVHVGIDVVHWLARVQDALGVES
jgi:methylmalonyl-CoA mutase